MADGDLWDAWLACADDIEALNLADSRAARELVRRAMAGDRDPYRAELEKGGAARAREDIDPLTWHSEAGRWVALLTPRLVATHAADPPRLTSGLLEAEEFVAWRFGVLHTAWSRKRDGAVSDAEQRLMAALDFAPERPPDRLQSLDLLAAGVAHTINNPLSIVTTNLGYVTDRLIDISKQDQSVFDLIEALRDARQGADRLLAVARKIRPRAPTPPLAPTPEPAPGRVEGRGRVLVVDDEVAITRVIRRTLAPGHDVTEMHGGREALARLVLDRDWDAILCDLMMPEMNGMELFSAVATLAPHLADKFVFLSGGVFDARVQAFLDNVSNARVEKPFDVVQLRTLIDARLRR